MIYCSDTVGEGWLKDGTEAAGKAEGMRTGNAEGVCGSVRSIGTEILSAWRYIAWGCQASGFFPWDDDIDVGMLRSDYERFVANAGAMLPASYFVQTRKTDLEWPANFAKIRDSRTTFVESSLKFCKINHGAYIDIFPLDYYPEAVSAQRKIDRSNWWYKRRISRVFYRGAMMESVLRKCVRSIAEGVSVVLVPTVQQALDRQEKLFVSTQPSKWIANYCGAWGKKEIVPAEWYGEGTMLTFEGMQVRAPKEYDKWLTQVYGDYMQLPPEEKRVGHHYYEVLDLDKPYTEYMK